MFSQRRSIVAGLVLGSAVCASAAYGFGWLDAWQERITDRFFVRQEAPHDVVIVALDEESIQAQGGWPVPRAAFAQVLSELSRASAVGIDVSFADPSAKGVEDDRIFAAALKDSPVPIVVLAGAFDARGGTFTKPLSVFGAHASVGYANVVVDYDGTVRRFNPGSETLSFASALLGTSATSETIRITYRGPEKTMLTIPFVDVHDGSLPAEFFDGKTVLIGATASDLHDTLQTPFGFMPGVEVHANALATLQDSSVIRDLPAPGSYVGIGLAALLAMLLITRLRRIHVLVLLVALGVVVIQVLGIVFFSYHLIVPTLAISLAYLLSSGSVLVFQYLTESEEKQFIRHSFQYYLTPSIIEEIITNPASLALGGKRQRVTVFFSDIRDFTSLSETLSPEVLTTLMNEYLTAMTDIVMDNRGLVDKYIGDAIMAFWGAPVAHPDTERDAAHAVLAMAARLTELNVFWEARGLPQLRIGVGLNAGEVVVGNMGSERRFNYTIMGDEVNFGSRLESLTTTYGVMCLVSSSVAEAIANEKDMRTREVDLIVVKGKQEPRRIFELITDEVDDAFETALVAFTNGRAAYMRGEWPHAISFFEEALHARPTDGPSRVLLERARAFLDTPPVAWDGVHVYTTK